MAGGKEAKSLNEILKLVKKELASNDYAQKTAVAYVYWIEQYCRFFLPKHPKNLKAEHVFQYVDSLKKVKQSSSTHNQAIAAISFLYKNVLGIELPSLKKARKKYRPRAPIFASPAEIKSIVELLDPMYACMALTIYGTGIKLLECCRIRLCDVNLSKSQLHVRDDADAISRSVPIPKGLKKYLQAQIDYIEQLHGRDVKSGQGYTVPPQSDSTMSDRITRILEWQFLFASSRVTADPKNEKILRRDRIHENMLQKVLRQAGLDLKLKKSINCHVLRNSYAAHNIAAGLDPEKVRLILGINDEYSIKYYGTPPKDKKKPYVHPMDQF